MRVISATDLLAEFNEAGVIDAAGVHLARTLGRLCGEPRPEVHLAAALLVTAQTSGSVCVRIDATTAAAFPAQTGEVHLDWPDPDQWRAMLASSPMVTASTEQTVDVRPLRLAGDLLYLERSWQAESLIDEVLTSRWSQPPEGGDEGHARAVTERVAQQYFPGRTSPTQREAVVTALTAPTSVISGGPGTGKTTTIALLLKALDELDPSGPPLRVELAAFTGKAAARMQESLDAATSGFAEAGWRRLRVHPATTLHSLLGSMPHRGFLRGPASPLTCDVLVIDEMSMVSLNLMTVVMSALMPTTRLVLVGDAAQLSSVEAGAVLADLVSAGMTVSARDERSAVIELTESHRFTGSISSLAQAVRRGDSGAAVELLRSGDPALTWYEADPTPAQLRSELREVGTDIVAQAQLVRQAALDGDPGRALDALDRHRLLCAHRHGRYGSVLWSAAVEEMLREAISGYGMGQWYPGRPLLVTRNVHELGISNGDTGVVVRHDGDSMVGLGTGGGVQLFSPMLLDSVDTLHAMTIHKSQGSEYDAVTIVLPAADSPILTRELIYTALTRARSTVRIIGTEASLVTAVNTPARRASGLAERLHLHP